jgi:hypothetical protein
MRREGRLPGFSVAITSPKGNYTASRSSRCWRCAPASTPSFFLIVERLYPRSLKR